MNIVDTPVGCSETTRPFDIIHKIQLILLPELAIVISIEQKRLMKLFELIYFWLFINLWKVNFESFFDLIQFRPVMLC